MTLKQILNKTKNILPLISLGISLDSLYVGRSERNARLNQETNEINRLSSELDRNKDIIIAQQDNQNKIAELTYHANQQISSIKNTENIINEINNKLNNINLPSNEKDNLVKELDNHFEILRNSIEITKNNLNKVNEIINENIPNESSIFENIQLFIQSYKQFLSTLELEQLTAIAHLSGLIFIISGLLTIFSIIYSDYLINYFNLEVKFPRINKLLLLRKKINKYSLLYYIIMISIVILILVILDI
jgi:hypothetical protein